MLLQKLAQTNLACLHLIYGSSKVDNSDQFNIFISEKWQNLKITGLCNCKEKEQWTEITVMMPTVDPVETTGWFTPLMVLHGIARFHTSAAGVMQVYHLFCPYEYEYDGA